MTNTINVTTLSEFISHVGKFHTDNKSMHGDLWFRGQNDSRLQLMPGVIWRQIEERKETSIISEFLNNSSSLGHENPINGWQQYALMQHYGLPTRLLDWTKAPLTALYFALNGDSKKDRMVWCIDPFELNQMSHQKDTIFTPDSMSEDDGIDIVAYLPKQLRENKSISIPMQPIAIEPPFSNRRILAQQGCFTVHGKNASGIDTLYDKDQPTKIHRLCIKNRLVENIRNELYKIGIGEDSIFPDLDSLTKRIVREYCQ